MTYSIVEFARSLQIDRCKIKEAPDLIFLCGGPTAEHGKYLSGRDFFYRYLQKNKPELAKRVRLAEEIGRWFHKDNAFHDLLELENYLAHLAEVVVLFVESPGSIAELGVFAASTELRPKTIAVLSTLHSTDNTFIADGPVRKIRNEDSERVYYYAWDPKKPNSSVAKSEFLDIASTLTTALELRHASRKKQISLSTECPGHTLLLILDLVRIAGVLTKGDLTACLRALGCESARTTLNEHLSTLESVGFINQRRRSNQSFYVSTSQRSAIRYAYRRNAPLRDLQRVQTEIRKHLEPVRRGVLRTFLSKRPSGA